MTIDEAAKLLRDFHSGPIASYTHEVRYKLQEARSILAAEYLRLTDPTPITAELVEQELGKPDRIFIPTKSMEWKIGRHGILWYSNRILIDMHDLKIIDTLGDQRQIVGILKGKQK